MPVLDLIERTTIRTEAIEPPLPTCTQADPFLIDHDCINPRGHQPIPSCGEIACFHCARIIWS